MKKVKFEDDGRTIASMDFEQIPYGLGGSKTKRTSKESSKTRQHEISQDNTLHLTKKEMFAMVIGLYQVIIPIVLLFVTLYFIAFLLLDILWLK